MTPLVDVAIRAGYTIISNNSPTCLEVAGNGEWAKVEKACRRFILHAHAGHTYDHYTVVRRNADGTRELRDVGVNGVRTGTLPPVGFKYPRNTVRHERHPHDFATGTPGVYARGLRFIVRAHHQYVQTCDTYEDAMRIREEAIA